MDPQAPNGAFSPCLEGPSARFAPAAIGNFRCRCHYRCHANATQDKDRGFHRTTHLPFADAQERLRECGPTPPRSAARVQPSRDRPTMAGTCHSPQIAPRISHEDQPRLQEPSRWSAGQMQLADGVRHAAVALPLQGCELMPAHVEQRRQDTAGHARPRPRRWTLVFPRPLRAGRSVRRYGRTRCCHSVGGAPRVDEDQRVDRPGMERRHRRAHPRIRVTGSLALPHELGALAPMWAAGTASWGAVFIVIAQCHEPWCSGQD
jgi:hypothetical protein